MEKIILFFGSFDPLHKGHIITMEKAIKKVNADRIYLGLNKSSKKGKLTSFFHRKKMLLTFVKDKKSYDVLNFSFDYNNLDNTYNNIKKLIKPNNKYYILIGLDQLNSFSSWYEYDWLYKNFDFIVSLRENNSIDLKYTSDNKFIFIDHQYKGISSSLIKQKKYDYTSKEIARYIIDNNLYLKQQIKPYLNQKRLSHSISVSKTALLINNKAKLNLDKRKIEKAALLHDIAKNIEINKAKKLLDKFYPQYRCEDEKLIHQYLGEYIAKKEFFIEDKEILSAIKYHTSGKKNMTTLEKLIYVADKIDPKRNTNNNSLLELCFKDFEKGFVEVVRNNKLFLEEKGIRVSNKDTIECYECYL